MHLIHRMSNYFCRASAPHGNYDPAVTILSRISLASRCRGTGPMTRADGYCGPPGQPCPCPTNALSRCAAAPVTSVAWPYGRTGLVQVAP